MWLTLHYVNIFYINFPEGFLDILDGFWGLKKIDTNTSAIFWSVHHVKQ